MRYLSSDSKNEEDIANVNEFEVSGLNIKTKPYLWEECQEQVHVYEGKEIDRCSCIVENEKMKWEPFVR